MTLAYTRTGSPGAPAIIFLHGNAMGQWMWHDQVQHFSDYDCLNVDLPGHGGSNHIPWTSFDGAADHVAQLITDVVPDKPVFVVGMSLGAVVGLHLLLRHPGKVERAVLTGAFADAPPHWMMTLQGGLLSVLLTTGWGKQIFARMLQIPPEAMPYYSQSIDELSIRDFKQIIRQIADYTPPDGLAALNVPVLFVTGEKDVSLNRQSVQQLAGQVPGAVGIYAPGVHHGWNGEDPALFNEMARAWIEGQPLPNRLIPAAA